MLAWHRGLGGAGLIGREKNQTLRKVIVWPGVPNNGVKLAGEREIEPRGACLLKASAFYIYNVSTSIT